MEAQKKKSEKWNSKIADFATKIRIEKLNNIYGKELKNKLNNLLAQNKISYFDIHELLKINPKYISEKNNKNISNEQLQLLKNTEEKNLCYLLDIFTNENIEAGIHRTGGSVDGAEIMKNGLFITGHSSSGAFSSYSSNNIKIKLEENISFYSSPGVAINQICSGGNYKNYLGKENVDIILVGIPKNITENDIILNNNSQQILNTKYIIGSVNVNSENDTINSVTKNPYINKNIENTNNNLNNEEYSLKKCYEISNQPENLGLKNKIINYFKTLKLNKEISIEPKTNDKER